MQPECKTTTCPDCGVPLIAGLTCRDLFDQLLAREFADPRYFGVHRLTVDTYSLQHPAQFMESAKSFVAHLTGMHVAMEARGSVPSAAVPSAAVPGRAERINRAVQQWLSRPRELERPTEPPPLARGDVHIGSVLAAATPAEHAEAVEAWARSTWAAWREHHGRARSWTRTATAGLPR